ncbi:GlsB/YeaQ/YmgE family stress response membrane protein [Croceicoccus sp. BE223]|uniref:GlsB/YeaQ/YmgE family stress response membrane protein n=1 Tax=Croceicoccus sp. BE223 TaxID=2817716 RepID=UPI0028577B8F|nr:GlsB/YeaQ/YmgE family stress response membrane protein [Croceicoccus sp. BE223]MDR7102231.1 putative membrane protein YeaQ/YmgE (transglycosylase-associated protein family) [Croceicoccus sp. BE223]
MDWIIAIIVGGIAGWLASMVMARDASMGILMNVIVGVVGAIVGKFVLGLLNIGADGNWLMWFIAALVGAIILLAIANLVQRGRVR